MFFFPEALHSRRNASVSVLWKQTLVCAGLALFGVAVGIGNIVVGTDTDDVHHTRWHIAGGSLYPGILVSVSPRHPLMYLCIPFLLRRLGCLKLIIRSALSFNLFKITPFKIHSRRSSHKRITTIYDKERSRI